MRDIQGICAGLLALAFVGPVAAADRTSPEFLRNEHAGTMRYASSEALGDLFPKLYKAAAECLTGDVAPGAGTGGGGAMGAVSSASREVVGVLAPQGDNAYVIVRAKGLFGAVQSNFLQIDLTATADGTRVDAFHKNDVKAQRDFLVEVQHWLDGELGFCKPKPFMAKKKSA